MAGKDKVKNIAEKADLLLRPVVEGLGYVLWDVEYKKEGSDYNLILTIDKEDQEVTIDDCVAVTDAVNPILDEHDPIQDSYCLEVSSAGLERDLTRDEHFEKYVGQEIEIKLFAPDEALGKNFVLPLVGNARDSLTFKKDDSEITLEKSKIAQAKAFVDYEKLFRESAKEED